QQLHLVATYACPGKGALPGSTTPSHRTRGTSMVWPEPTTPSSQQRRSRRAAAWAVEEAIYRPNLPRAATPKPIKHQQQQQQQRTPPAEAATSARLRRVSIKLERLKLPVIIEEEEQRNEGDDDGTWTYNNSSNNNNSKERKETGSGQSTKGQTTKHRGKIEQESMTYNIRMNVNDGESMQKNEGASQRMKSMSEIEFASDRSRTPERLAPATS
ncbi:hypothetical protein PV325_008595, partial [Microctonus aethiopoides]